MPHTYTNLLFHIVFSTKDWFPFIHPEHEERLYEYIGGTIRGLAGVCLEIGGMADHIHILVKLPPSMGMSKFVERLKPSVTKWARSAMHPKFEWQDGYGGFSVSESRVPAVRRYIQCQKEHHKKQNFRDEFKVMLKSAGIEYEEKFLWK
jgi:REP element-mobilizing transposase RayT